MNKLAAVVRERFEGQPCKDCEGLYAYMCYDLDHREPSDKNHDIRQLRTWRDTPENRAVLWKELAGCDWVCRNCHAIRTEKAREEGKFQVGRPKGSRNKKKKKGKEIE